MKESLCLLGVVLVGLGMLSGCQALPAGQTTAPAPASTAPAPTPPAGQTTAPAPVSTAPASTLPPQVATPTFRAVPLPGGQAKNTPEVPVMNEVPLSTPFDTTVAGLVTQAKADLARRLSIDPAQIELVSASSVTWPDGSLGCPQPGMAYTQVLVEGLRVQLRANGQVYDYHGGGSKPLFLCEQRGG